MLPVLHLIAKVGTSSFGLGPVALNLTKEQNRLDAAARIWCLDSDQERQWASSSTGLEIGNIRGFSVAGPRGFGYSREMMRAAREVSGQGEGPAVVNLHNLWTGLSLVTSVLRTRCGFPTVITPHGSLERRAVGKSSWKKKTALALYEGGNLRDASCIHAVSEKEVAGIRDFGLQNPIAVIPNGISDAWLNCYGDGNAFRQRFHIPFDTQLILFLSRITPIKGLPMLLEAVAGMRAQLAGWRLVLAGADEFGHQAEIEALVREYGLAETVVFVGPLFGQIKRDAFDAADLFVLPSYSEAAPIVILEALAAGVPVLATKAAPWQELETYNCGWWPDINSAALAEALRSAVGCSPAQLVQMGRSGKALVSAKCTWSMSAQMTIELYHWLLGRQERPAFVVTD